MSNYRFEMVQHNEASTGDDIECVHVMIDNTSNQQIGDAFIPFDDILAASVACGWMTQEKDDYAQSQTTTHAS